MHHHSHDHAHGHHHHHAHGELHGGRLGLAVLLNIVITVAQIIGGLLSGSLALLSDALHNASDVAALLISWIAQRIARRPHSARHTFGFKRAEIIAAVINTASLVAIAIVLIIEAAGRLFDPQPVAAGWVIALAGLGIVVNGGSMWLLSRGAESSSNLRAAWLHMLADTLTSVAVLASGVAMWLWQLWWLDSLLTLGIACYLIYVSWGLLVSTLGVLMQFTPPQIELSDIESAVRALPAVEGLHHAHVWQLDDQVIHFEAHVDFRDDLRLSDAQRVLAQIEQLLDERFGIQHCLLQPEFASEHDSALIASAAGCNHGHEHEHEHEHEHAH